MVEIHKQLFVNNECYLIGRRMTPTHLILHSTGANNPYLKRYVQPDDGILGTNAYGNHWNQYRPEGKQVCVHGFIGKDKNGIVRVYQTLPFNYRCWGCGSGKYSSGNAYAIQFEICEDSLTDINYFKQVYKVASELYAYLCTEYNIDPSNIMDHHEGYLKGIASNHGDVQHWFSRFGMTMDDFRDDVRKLITQPIEEEEEDTVKRYEKLLDIPAGEFHDTFKALVDAKVIKGYSGSGEDTILDVSDDMVRQTIWNFRAGIYDKAINR